MYTLGQAAKEIGCSKATLSRAIKNGKLSAKKNDDDTYAIDAAELMLAGQNILAMTFL